MVDISFSMTPSVVLAHRSRRFDSRADSQGQVLPGAHALLFENHGARDDTETVFLGNLLWSSTKIAVITSTKIERSKIDLAGVDTGEKMLVGLVSGRLASAAARDQIADPDIRRGPKCIRLFLRGICKQSLAEASGLGRATLLIPSVWLSAAHSQRRPIFG